MKKKHFGTFDTILGLSYVSIYLGNLSRVLMAIQSLNIWPSYDGRILKVETKQDNMATGQLNAWKVRVEPCSHVRLLTQNLLKTGWRIQKQLLRLLSI